MKQDAANIALGVAVVIGEYTFSLNELISLGFFALALIGFVLREWRRKKEGCQKSN